MGNDEVVLWCIECGRDSGFHMPDCSKVVRDIEREIAVHERRRSEARPIEPVLRGAFTCPKCQASHNRGPLNGVDVYRCLKCGETTKVTEATPGYYHPDLEIDAEVRKDIAEGQAAEPDRSKAPVSQPLEPRKWHTLKTWPGVFDAVADGTKTFEVRKNDRDFQAGDALRLMRFNPSAKLYTGAQLVVDVLYVLDGGAFGIEPGHVVMSIRRRPDATASQPLGRSEAERGSGPR